MCEREKYEKAKIKCDVTCCIVMCLQYIDTKHAVKIIPLLWLRKWKTPVFKYWPNKDSPLITPSFKPEGLFGRTGLPAQTPSQCGFHQHVGQWKWSWYHTSPVPGSCVSLGFSIRWLFPPTAQTDAETWYSPELDIFSWWSSVNRD